MPEYNLQSWLDRDIFAMWMVFDPALDKYGPFTLISLRYSFRIIGSGTEWPNLVKFSYVFHMALTPNPISAAHKLQ